MNFLCCNLPLNKELHSKFSQKHNLSLKQFPDYIYSKLNIRYVYRVPHKMFHVSTNSSNMGTFLGTACSWLLLVFKTENRRTLVYFHRKILIICSVHLRCMTLFCVWYVICKRHLSEKELIINHVSIDDT